MNAANRPFHLHFQNGEYDLLVRSFNGEEAISRLFRFKVLAHAEVFIPTNKLLGQDVTFTIDLRESQRTFLAKVASVEEFGVDDYRRVLYALELVPRIWAKTQTIRARVFENMDPLDIVKEVLSGPEASVHIDRRPDSYHARPYCVQYFESNFNFALRLLEEEGYIFRYGAAETMPAISIGHFFSSSDSIGKLSYAGAPGGCDERIVSWKNSRVLTATAVSARDHMFHANSPLLEGEAKAPGPQAGIPGWEPLEALWSASIDRYPGQWAHLFEEVGMNGTEAQPSGYIDAGPIRAWHDLRQVAGSTSGNEAVSNCHRVAPGHVFELTDHPVWAGPHLIVSVRHNGSQGLDHSSDEAHAFEYENQFTSVPFANTMMYLPPRTTRKPVIHGCQTATVVGPEGVGEIWTDKYGRVQARFWWERSSSPSCWIRVATPWAGNNWGVQHVPRIGQEVVVTFLDGDPDRPLIVGSVYNPLHMPPFKLPANRTQSGIRTHSTTDGTDSANEIRFEDAKGSEELYFHAQKDRISVVENLSREWVGTDRLDAVGGSLHETTADEKRELIGGKSSLTVGGDCMNAFLQKLGIGAGEIHLKAGKIVIEADKISIRTTDKGGEFMHIEKGGGITIDSRGDHLWINSCGVESPEDGCFVKPDQPTDPFPAPAEVPAPPPDGQAN